MVKLCSKVTNWSLSYELGLPIGKPGKVGKMNQIINEKLGAWLLVSGNTREKLADEIGITKPTLASRLNGHSRWAWEEVIKVSHITGATLNELAGM